MPEKYQYSLPLSSLHEVETRIGPGPTPQIVPLNPLELFETLPPDSLLFGFASDGLPLMLHLRNPQPGPVLVIGDQGCGKTDFLKKLVLSTQRLMPPGEIQFAVLTDFPDEWARVSAPEHLLGVWSISEPVAADLLYQLDCRVETPDENQPTILLFDGLDSLLALDDESQNDLADLLARGPQSLIWPLVTVNAEQALELPEWLAFFQTRILGRISDTHIAQQLASMPGAPLSSLSSNSQFCLRENSHWLKFWLPSLHE
jgi:hypothetical protein